MIKSYLKIGLIAASFAFPGMANALSITQTISEFTGDPLDVRILIQDDAELGVATGTLKFTITVDDTITGNIGDLRGAFFHVTPESLISGLSVTGADVTDDEFDANNVNNLGGGANINPGGPFDFGVEIGTSGVAGDDIQTTMFVLSHNSMNLSLSIFDGLPGDVAAVRAMSVGPAGGSRNGSSKLGGPLPPPGTNVPEPGTLFLMGSGLAGLGLWRWKTKK